MRRWKWFLVVVTVFAAFAFFGCSEGKEEPAGLERPDSGLDYQPATVASGGASLFWETEEGYYIIYTPGEEIYDSISGKRSFSNVGKRTDFGNHVGGYLYRSDKDTLNWKEVCSNQRCSHTGSYCEGLLAQGRVSFGICGGRIYFPSVEYVEANEIGLYSMEMDGSDRQLYALLPYEKGWSAGGLFHDVYYIYYMYQLNEEQGTMDENIYVYSLKDGEGPVLVLQEKGAEDLASYRIYPVGEKVYFMRKSKQEGNNICYRYDLNEGTMETLWEHCPQGSLWPEEEGGYIISGEGDVYYQHWNTGERETVLETDGQGAVYFDGTYFFTGLNWNEEVMLDQKLRIQNKDGE